MRDDLIGFVVGALDAPEHEVIRQKVEQCPELQQQVELLRKHLQPLECLADEVSPPVGLAERTCQNLDRWLEREGEFDQPVIAGGELTEEDASLASCGVRVMDTMDQMAGVEVDPCEEAGVTLGVPRQRLASAGWGSNRLEAAEVARQWTMADFVVAAGVCLAASCLFFPAIINSRYHAQLAGCQNKLRQLGVALNEYSGGVGGRFPMVTGRGPTSVAGSYVPILAEKGLVTDGRLVLCPAKQSTYLLKIPTMQDLSNMEGPQLVRLYRDIGGDYAYPLGYMRKGRLQGIRNEGQSYLAVMADAPLQNLRNVSIGTHGRGQNVLFQDGHVGFMTVRTRPGSNDDLFLNDEGIVRAGLHEGDYVLGASESSPLGPPVQVTVGR